MPCRDWEDNPHAIAAAARQRNDALMAQLCRTRKILIDIMLGRLTVADFAASEEYQKLYNEQIEHRTKDRDAYLKDLMARIQDQTRMGYLDKAKELIDEHDEVAKMPPSDLLFTDKF